MIGKTLDGKYQIVDRLGAGGMGAVYEAVNVATRGRVAIKVILGELAADESLVVRFQREARAAGAIESRHIARVIDAGKDPESSAPYLVMELLRGQDVDALMKRFGPLRPTLALRIVAQALAGLERAHAAEVVHRDIKPANLYLAQSDGGQRVVKLVDFGIAKVKDDVTASREFSLTQTASLLGSPLYMSPEQARTSKTVDGRADLWSLGVVLYQMLAGRAPHANAGSLTELLLAICTEPAVPVQERAPWVPPEVARVVTRAIEIEQGKRFKSATEMLAEIAAIVPDWQQLDEAMLAAMTDEERAFVAAKLEPAPELGVSTGPRSTRDAMLHQGSILEAPTVVPAVRAHQGSAHAEAAVRSGDYERTALATSKPGVGAISAPGASMPDGLASTKAETTASTRSSAKGRLLPFAVGGALVVGLAGALALGARGTTNERSPSGVVAVPTESAPPVSGATAPGAPEGATAPGAPEGATAPGVATEPPAVAASSAPARSAPPPARSTSASPAESKPAASAAKPSDAVPASPHPKPPASAPKAPATAASSSPISRDFD